MSKRLMLLRKRAFSGQSDDLEACGRLGTGYHDTDDGFSLLVNGAAILEAVSFRAARPPGEAASAQTHFIMSKRQKLQAFFIVKKPQVSFDILRNMGIASAVLKLSDRSPLSRKSSHDLSLSPFSLL